MILSYNYAEEHNQSSISKSVSKSNTVMTESILMNSRSSRSSSASKADLRQKLYDSKLFEDMFDKGTNKSAHSLEKKNSYKTTDDIPSLREESFLQKNLANLLNLNSMKRYQNISFSKDLHKINKNFNESSDSFLHKDISSLNEILSKHDSFKTFDISSDKSGFSNSLLLLQETNEKLKLNQSITNEMIQDLHKASDMCFETNKDINLPKHVVQEIITQTDNRVISNTNINNSNNVDDNSQSNQDTKIRNTFKETTPFYPKNSRPITDTEDGFQNDLHYVIPKFTQESQCSNVASFYLSESKRPTTFDSTTQQNNFYHHNSNLMFNLDGTECFNMIEDPTTKFIRTKGKSSTYNPTDQLPGNYVYMSDVELSKYCHIISKEQAGCRFLQKRIEENPGLVNNLIFFEIFDYAISLMYDCFANYFIQKVIEQLSQDKLEQIINLISPEFTSLGMNPYGTRVIQKIIDMIKSDRILRKISELLQPNLMIFVKDANACHILIKFATVIKPPHNSLIFNFLGSDIYNIATHKHSCSALQKCFDVANDQQKAKLYVAVIESSNNLIADQHGNYVIQYVIAKENYDINYKIIQAISKNIINLSKQKFSSNVIEKCFDHCDDRGRLHIIKSICETNKIHELLLDMYGNYVVQKILSCSQEPYSSFIISSIGPHMEKLKLLNFGTKLYTKLLIMYPKLNYFVSMQNMAKESFITTQRKGVYPMSMPETPIPKNPQIINYNNINLGSNMMNYSNPQFRNFNPMMTNPMIGSSMNQFNYQSVNSNNPFINNLNQNNHLYSNLYNSNYSQNVNFNFYPK